MEWNNYKNYTEESLNKLLLIKRAKGFGFTLNEIKEILDLFGKNEATCETLATKIKDKLNTIDQKIKDLNEMKMMILGKIENISGECIPTSNENCQSV